MSAPAHVNQRMALERRDLAAARAAGVGDDPVPLPADTLPCFECGVPVPRDPDREPLTTQALARAGDPPRPPGTPINHLLAEFGLCPECTARQGVTRSILRKFPSLSARLGPWGAEVKVSSALAALAALAQPMPDVDTLTGPALGSLLARMSGPGADCAWSTRFAPVLTAPPGTCAQFPWAGVSSTTRLALRTGLGAVYADKVAAGRPEQALPPPDPAGPGVAVPGACLLCGVGVVVRSAADCQALGGIQEAQRAVWSPIAAPPGAIGGAGAPAAQNLAGHTCPDCTEARERVGSIGQTSMGRSLAGHLRATGREHDADRVQRGEGTIVAWGVLAYSARRRGHTYGSNADRWGHVRLS